MVFQIRNKDNYLNIQLHKFKKLSKIIINNLYLQKEYAKNYKQ